jgi:hypothetical protein
MKRYGRINRVVGENGKRGGMPTSGRWQGRKVRVSEGIKRAEDTKGELEVGS